MPFSTHNTFMLMLLHLIKMLLICFNTTYFSMMIRLVNAYMLHAVHGMMRKLLLALLHLDITFLFSKGGSHHTFYKVLI